MGYFEFVSTPVGYTKAQRAVSAALYSITIPIALTGNLLLIFIVTRRPKTRTLTGFLFVNMAAADLLVTLVDMPSAMAVPYTSIQWPPGIMGDITCKAVYFGFFVNSIYFKPYTHVSGSFLRSSLSAPPVSTISKRTTPKFHTLAKFDDLYDPSGYFVEGYRSI